MGWGSGPLGQRVCVWRHCTSSGCSWLPHSSKPIQLERVEQLHDAQWSGEGEWAAVVQLEAAGIRLCNFNLLRLQLTHGLTHGLTDGDCAVGNSSEVANTADTREML